MSMTWRQTLERTMANFKLKATNSSGIMKRGYLISQNSPFRIRVINFVNFHWPPLCMVFTISHTSQWMAWHLQAATLLQQVSVSLCCRLQWSKVSMLRVSQCLPVAKKRGSLRLLGDESSQTSKISYWWNPKPTNYRWEWKVPVSTWILTHI